MLRKGTHNNRRLQEDFNKYGEDNFIFRILEKLDNLENSIEREQYYIDKKEDKYNIGSSISGGDLFTNNPRKDYIRNIRREQMSGKGNHQYGKEKTKKMILSVKKANSKPIIINGKYFSSINEASRILNINDTTIQYRLNAKSEKFKGWEYKT